MSTLLFTACRSPTPSPPPPPGRGGDCASCHPAQAKALASSHHAKGQAKAGVLPPGAAGAFRTDGVSVSWPETDGGTARAPIRYTLGVEPLVQVAVELPATKGVRVPPIALIDGGWRELPTEFEWRSGPAYDWAASCAPCHATGMVVAPPARWHSLSVTCEACHGKQGDHFAFALSRRTEFRFAPDAGGGAIATPLAGASPDDVQLEVCAACHSRRRALTDDGALAGRLFDRFEPALLERGLYAANGAVADEVFEVGSFLMSPMSSAGVTCSNCHEPHSGALRAEGNALCAQCHRPPPEHGAGASCVSCHLPPKTFLTVDARRDHFLHGRERTAEAAFEAAFDERPEATALLSGAAEDARHSSFMRASALALLREPTEPLRRAISSADPWLRYGAATALGNLEPEVRVALGAPLLTDPLRAVRVRAGRALIGLSELPPTLEAELEAAERANATRGDAWLNLGAYALAKGDRARGEALWRQGLTVDARFAPLVINLADLLRDAEGLALLEAEAGRAGPWRTQVAYALALARWRARDREGALAAFRVAKEDGSELHLRAWVMAERDVAGPAAFKRALAEAQRVRPSSRTLRELAAP